jgi:hypothetical protein
MPRPPSYTPEQKELVLSLRTSGLSHSQIAIQAGVPRHTVKDICTRLSSSSPVVIPKTEVLSRPRESKIKNDLGFILDRMPELSSLSEMDMDQRLDFWERSWNVLRDAAVEAQDIKLLDSLITKFRASTISKIDIEPTVEIQPIRYSPILPTLKMIDVAKNLTEGLILLIKGKHLSQDQADQLFSAVNKYYPGSKAND